MSFQMNVERDVRSPEVIAADALRAKVEHAVEAIARLACEVDGKSLPILADSLNAAAKDMRAAIDAQWGNLTAQQLAALLHAYPKSQLPAAPMTFDYAMPADFSVGAAFRDRPDSLLKWLLVGTRRRPLSDADTAVALVALGDMLSGDPAARLLDVYEALHSKPELASFAADVKAAFIPS